MKKFLFVWLIIILLGVVGEIKCIVHMCQCNWAPIGKAEVIYTAATFTGCGSVVGWIDIKDN